jgi:hypothetical protein
MKTICKECDSKNLEKDLLLCTLEHRGKVLLNVLACPTCYGTSLVYACDEPECWEPASCGWKSPTGYRNTCYDHS